MSDPFEVIVVGGGHAGCEAALAAARMGQHRAGHRVRVALVTLNPGTIGALSCNPAMGGVGKGQLIRELDALGGAMGQVTDHTAIQYRVLNTSKGEAVQSLRAQVDKDAYARAMQARLAATEGLTVIAGSVEGLLIGSGGVRGVVLADGSEVRARRVILTNGTFLRGLMHTGESKTTGGRIGEDAVVGLSGELERLGFEAGRLKTGTPPRLSRASIDFSVLTPQPGEAEPDGFSHFLPPPRREWVQCHVTRTDETIHEVIRDNLDRSPMYSGNIEGIGPRYCPSIEDKVVRFPDRSGHTVHLEPEGRDGDSIYVNGISTSLPSDVQEEIVRRLPGCAGAKFLRYGYAVEYDFFPPHQIRTTFETRRVDGLYMAGQICGTSGYEEAGVQGFLAGVNAVRSLRDEPAFELSRDQAYIGVLADDLVRCDPREPYRMFTARAEYRLLLRHDNADLRLVEIGESLGLVDPRQADVVRKKRAQIDGTLELLRERRIAGEPLIQRLRRPGARFEDVVGWLPEDAGALSEDVKRQVAISARYEHYIDRQHAQIEKARRMEEWRLPESMPYDSIPGLRTEAREKLARFRPATLGQAGRIAGVTPADISILMVALRARGEA
ncbi:MAG: tRNA uridine-5-carboxymethylaminomethyl(34) synthesis enzyme MnmG, partial [Planctomycetes bacterium]|nr:tRNA uridine-5-carboxymethylaminomethyl(34) synthesis enzyme MnmG [Planctomycetota bacterium]